MNQSKFQFICIICPELVTLCGVAGCTAVSLTSVLFPRITLLAVAWHVARNSAVMSVCSVCHSEAKVVFLCSAQPPLTLFSKYP